MSTASVRKFLISLDPDEPLDYAEDLSFFEEAFERLGLEKVATYTWRFTDQECMIKITLNESTDGFNVLGYVQASCEHEYRLRQVAEEIGGSIMTPRRSA